MMDNFNIYRVMPGRQTLASGRVEKVINSKSRDSRSASTYTSIHSDGELLSARMDQASDILDAWPERRASKADRRSLSPAGSPVTRPRDYDTRCSTGRRRKDISFGSICVKV